MGQMNSASEDIKSAFRKNRLYLIFFIALILCAIIGLLMIGILVFQYTKIIGLSDRVVTEEVVQESEEDSVALSAVNGTIVDISSASITIEIPMDDGAMPLSFELTEETTYTLLTYRNAGEGTERTETVLDPASLLSGDTVIVYTASEIGMVTSQPAVSIVKLVER